MATNKEIAQLSGDIYGVNKYVEEIKKKFTPDVNEDTLMLGIFGYTGQVLSELLQNSIVMASEFSNESIPTKAKFEKNIIAHALGMGISDINATPAQFDVLLTFIEDDIIAQFANKENGEYEFIFDCDTPIYIGDHCFHADYDIKINRIKLNDGRYTYSALYDMSGSKNPISDITNPYLTSPVSMNVNGTNVIFTKCTLHQVTKSTQHKKVLGDTSINAKTFTFTFDGQLAAFTIDVKEGNKAPVHLVPVYEGLTLDIDTGGNGYFYYTYLDSNTIRVKFDRSSYSPRTNCEVEVNIQITEGEAGNFTFDPNIYPSFSFESEKYKYSNIGCEIRPITGDSVYGTNKKTIEDLQKLIPKEALSRGSITNVADLENFFNAINTDESKVYIYKKRDNALQRLYYSYILIKDMMNNIIPTNTIDLHIKATDLVTEENSDKLILEKGKVIYLNRDDINGDYGTVSTYNIDSEDKSDEFKYIIPYNFVISKIPLYGKYFLTTIDAKKFLNFEYIDDKALYHYIATSIYVSRPYLKPSQYPSYEITEDDQNTDNANFNFNIKIDDDANVAVDVDIDGESLSNVGIEDSKKPVVTAEDEELYEYSITITMEQNITMDNLYPMVFYDEETNEIICNVRCIMELMNDDEQNPKPYRWAEGKIIDFNREANILYFRFTFKTKDLIDAENRIRIEKNGLYGLQSTKNEEVGYFKANITANIYILSLQEDGNKTLVKSKLPYLIPDGEDTLTGDFEFINESTGERSKEKREYTLSNIYNIVGGLDFFYDFSSIVNSTVTAVYKQEEKETGEISSSKSKKKTAIKDSEKEIVFDYYKVTGVPVLKYNYIDSEDKALYFCQELTKRKNYIDYAIEILEDAFEMNFKFFNTYGPSKLFTTPRYNQNEDPKIDRVNLNLAFRLKLKPNYDTNIINNIIAEVKDYIEDINEITSIHIPNLITHVTSKFSESIEFFEFLNLNDYGVGYQHIKALEMPDDIITPEFVNIQTYRDEETNEIKPDITIVMA